MLKAVLSIIGAIAIVFALFQGYQAFTAGEYVGLFIPFIVLMAGVNIFFLGLHGKKALKPLGKKLVSIGIGVVIIAVFLNYTSAGSTQIKDSIANAMIDTMSELSAKEVQRQLDSGEFSLPETKEGIRRECGIEEIDEKSFTTADICVDIDKEENKDLTVEELIKLALNKKTRKLAEEQVNKEVGENNDFNTMFDSFNKSKRFVLLLGIAGVLMFILGGVFDYLSREKNKIFGTIYSVSFNSTIVCAINAVIFKLVDYLIKDQLVSGKIMTNKLLQGIIPSNGDKLMQEVTTKILMKVGEVIYGWLGVALQKVFVLSVVLGIIFLVLTVMFYMINKRNDLNEERVKNKV